MHVNVRFVDGEQLEGEAEQVSLDRGGFTLTGTGGNTRSVWVGSGAIKYIVLQPPGTGTAEADADPREGLEHSKVVLHFLDGEILYSYKDEVFGEQPGGFVLRLWDRDRHQLVRALVAGNSLKGVFFVDEWDSRTDLEKRSRAAPDEATSQWIDHAVAAADAPTPGGPAPEVELAEPAALQGPMLVEEPELLEEPLRAPEPELPDTPVPVPGPVQPEDRPAVADNPVVALVVGDAEERRPSFRSALTPRRKVGSAVPGPEELRYRMLRARISEVLGQAGPADHKHDADPDEVS